MKKITFKLRKKQLVALLIALSFFTIASIHGGIKNSFIFSNNANFQLTASQSNYLQYNIENAYPNLSFTQPLGIYHSNDGTNRTFVVEKGGTIWVFNSSKNSTTKYLFLDVSSLLDTGDEVGLLGLAFHPNYSTNGIFFIDYVAAGPRRTVVASYKVNESDPNKANLSSAITVIEVDQPFSNHNGGQIAFGPDNYLYIALGDGGGSGDPLNNSQNRSTLLGSILRINVSTLPYTIPTDNPFFGNSEGFKEEIYAYGLRNPWRFSFDFVTGWFWVADVGEHLWEEIDIIESGKNYGWHFMEGNHHYTGTYNISKLELPIFEYPHPIGDSITGGFVYRGADNPLLYGHYVYGDFITGKIWALLYDGVNAPTNVLLSSNPTIKISSFGLDENNELLIVNFGGSIYRLKYNPLGLIEILITIYFSRQAISNENPYFLAGIFALVSALGVLIIIIYLKIHEKT